MVHDILEPLPEIASRIANNANCLFIDMVD